MKILILSSEYISICGRQIGNVLLKLNQKYLELGGKSRKLLALQLKGTKTKCAVNTIKSKLGILIIDFTDIIYVLGSFPLVDLSSPEIIQDSFFWLKLGIYLISISDQDTRGC